MVHIPYSEVAHFYGLNDLACESFVVTESPSHPQLAVPDQNIPEVENTTSQNDERRTTLIKWGNAETKFMLNLYAALIKCVGPLKKFRKKKQMWAHIAAETNEKFGLDFNAIQVETRYKCVIKRTKKAIYNNNTSGAVRETTEFDDEIFEIVNQDDSLCPEYAISPGKIVKKSDIFPPKNQIATSNSEPSFSGASSSQLLTEQASAVSEPMAGSNSSPEIPWEYDADDPCSSPELTSEAEILPSQNNRRRKKKPYQQVLFERYLQQKAKKYERQENLYLEKQNKKAEREKDKELNREKRHAEKMKMLEMILNSRK